MYHIFDSKMLVEYLWSAKVVLILLIDPKGGCQRMHHSTLERENNEQCKQWLVATHNSYLNQLNCRPVFVVWFWCLRGHGLQGKQPIFDAYLAHLDPCPSHFTVNGICKASTHTQTYPQCDLILFPHASLQELHINMFKTETDHRTTEIHTFKHHTIIYRNPE